SRVWSKQARGACLLASFSPSSRKIEKMLLKIEKRSMESDSHSRGDCNVHLYANILATLLCFMLVLFSFIFIDANSHAAASKQGLGQSDTVMLTSVKTGTATSTPTPTPTATN